MPLAGRSTVHPALMSTIARFYPQTVTIERKETERDEWGQPVPTWVELDGHVDLPARVVSNGPGTGAGGWSGVTHAPDGTYDAEGLTISLPDRYPDISRADRVRYQGNAYDLDAAPEYDAEGVTTRLRTKRVS